MVLNTLQIDKLFDDKQVNGWSARGNPYLWREIKHRFLTDKKNLENEVDFFEYFFDVFYQLTGVKIDGFDTIHIERYAVGSGMSDGTISSDFWNEMLLLLVKRFMEIKTTEGEIKLEPDTNATKIIQAYQDKITEFAKDPNPGTKAIVIYGEKMLQTHLTNKYLRMLNLGDCNGYYSGGFNSYRKNWINQMIISNRKGLPIIVFDNAYYPYKTLKGKVPEYNELVKSIPCGNFGFTLTEPFTFHCIQTDEKDTIPAGFYKIKSNLIFHIKETIPKDLIEVMPSFSFDFDPKSLLLFLRANLDDIVTDIQTLTPEMGIDLIDRMLWAFENKLFTKLDMSGVYDVFLERHYYEQRKIDGEPTGDIAKLLTAAFRRIDRKYGKPAEHFLPPYLRGMYCG